MKNLKATQALTKTALVAAVYVAVSYAFAFAASGQIQFRIAEILNLLAIFNPIYIVGVTLGCVITNLLTSTPIDAIVGSCATLAATGLIYTFRNRSLWGISLFALINGPIVALELWQLFGLDFWFTLASVTFSEFVVVTVLGVPLFKLLSKNKKFVETVK